MSVPPEREYTGYSDVELLQLVAKNNVRAYEVFCHRHTQVVYNLLMRIVRDKGTAEELLQEVFWQIWQKAAQYQGRGSVAAWLLRIARNRALDQLRRQKARPQTVQIEVEAVEQNTVGVQASTEVEIEQIWSRQQVQQALDKIPQEQQICLQLAYFDGLSQREIAEYCKISTGTVKSRIRLGLEKLEKLLRVAGFP